MQVIATFYRFGHGIDFIDRAIKWPQKIYLYLLPIMVFGDFIYQGMIWTRFYEVQYELFIVLLIISICFLCIILANFWLWKIILCSIFHSIVFPRSYDDVFLSSFCKCYEIAMLSSEQKVHFMSSNILKDLLDRMNFFPFLNNFDKMQSYANLAKSSCLT